MKRTQKHRIFDYLKQSKQNLMFEQRTFIRKLIVCFKFVYILLQIVKDAIFLCNNGRDVPDPDSTIRYPVKCRHPALSGIQVKFAGYSRDSTVTYFIRNIK